MAYELAQQIFENLVAFRFRTTLNLQTGDAKRPGAHLFNFRCKPLRPAAAVSRKQLQRKRRQWFWHSVIATVNPFGNYRPLSTSTPPVFLSLLSCFSKTSTAQWISIWASKWGTDSGRQGSIAHCRTWSWLESELSGNKRNRASITYSTIPEVIWRSRRKKDINRINGSCGSHLHEDDGSRHSAATIFGSSDTYPTRNLVH